MRKYGDGVIDFEEFKRLMYHKMKHTDGSEEIKDFFLVLDRDSSGYFTADDLYKVDSVSGVSVLYDIPFGSKVALDSIADKKTHFYK
ncbi:CALN-like protein [Mya arenaria]|uniref:CALN-like protein n=1 Tax=Mya arenaria TaxID=6604 RepID=A0ABY7EMI2_MYAAR|nr:CALN-like protein [Mya arenaria]